MKTTAENSVKCKEIEVKDGSISATLLMAVTPEKETEKAIYVMVVNPNGGYNKMFWIPKSVVESKEHSFSMPAWFINKNFYSLIK